MQRVTQRLPRTSAVQVRKLATKPSPTASQSDDTAARKDADPVVLEAEKVAATEKSTKTMAEKDAELMQKLAGISGDGGESGVEYEDGKASAMKRSVKNNMFRLI
ncbi:uncharacterized protein RCC_08930 [Ramularia collo-cygni]|uniref:Uncharacterized protein n=1 Tax=Ramularia collo-cygni TaxID=112498 RepID=A0A2D3VIX0_9PEZI|nr:uncharacterized protein RCC_08930 [Ramularia collo-cygni]CZT23219.1 uncharacterized protein RCC_08930 [Ramularia collo-cygni]